MLMINYTRSCTEADLFGILRLQQANLAHNLPDEEIQTQGFVTVVHSLEDLAGLNDTEAHVIAKDGDKVIGYLLAMTKKSQFDIPILVPMFEKFNEVKFRDQFISAYNYIVVGQVCIDKSYRGQGIFDKCYYSYRNYFKNRYDFAITEIDSKNIRSLNAHRRVGFSTINKYQDGNGREWVIVLWDWKRGQ
jgi:ribosomal protein S18 acetylase RimI-like enzyme